MAWRIFTKKPQQCSLDSVSDKDYRKLNKKGREMITEIGREKYALQEENVKLCDELTELQTNFREYRLDRETEMEDLQQKLKEIQKKYEEERSWHMILKQCEQLAEEKSRALEKELDVVHHYVEVHREQKKVLRKVLGAQSQEIARLQGKKNGDTSAVSKILDEVARDVYDMERRAAAHHASLPKRDDNENYNATNLDKYHREAQEFLQRMKEIRGSLEEALGESPEPVVECPVTPLSPTPTVSRFAAVRPCTNKPTDEMTEILKNKDLHIDVLMKQLRSVGVEPVSEVLSLEEAKDRVFKAMKRLNDGDESAEKDLDKWLAFIKNHPDTIAAEQKKGEEFLTRHKSANETALKVTRSMVPPDIWVTTLHDLKTRGLHESVADRVWKKRALWLTRYPAEKIARMHLGLLRDKFAYDTLDLVELRALYMCLPKKFEADPNKDKEAWGAGVLSLLQSNIAKEEKKELARERKRASCYMKQGPFGPFDADAPSVLPEIRESVHTRFQDLKDELDLCRRRSFEDVSKVVEEEAVVPVTVEKKVAPVVAVAAAAAATVASPTMAVNATPSTTRKWWQPSLRPAHPDIKKEMLTPTAPQPSPQTVKPVVTAAAPRPSPAITAQPPKPPAPLSSGRSFMDEIKSRRKD